MKKKTLFITTFILSLVVISSLFIIRPLEDPPTVDQVIITNHAVC